jgi:hypothetical protein
MIQKIKSYLFMSSAAIMLLVPAVTAGTISMAAACSSSVANQVAVGVNASTPSNDGVDCGATNVGDSSIENLAKRIITTFSIIVGAASVIMIIYGGFRYITSGGESGRVGAAKNSLIYAIIGLVIVALAQVIIHFVLNQTDQITAGT